MGTKNNPGQFDCYAKADADEPMFILLGRDPVAGAAVRFWADTREALDPSDPKVAEARQCADQMDEWARILEREPVSVKEAELATIEDVDTEALVAELERRGAMPKAQAAAPVQAGDRRRVAVIVNGRQHVFHASAATYQDVVNAACGTGTPAAKDLHTVTYSHSASGTQGTLAPGENVQLHEGMVFAAAVTGKA